MQNYDMNTEIIQGKKYKFLIQNNQLKRFKSKMSEENDNAYYKFTKTSNLRKYFKWREVIY